MKFKPFTIIVGAGSTMFLAGWLCCSGSSATSLDDWLEGRESPPLVRVEFTGQRRTVVCTSPQILGYLERLRMTLKRNAGPGGMTYNVTMSRSDGSAVHTTVYVSPTGITFLSDKEAAGDPIHVVATWPATLPGSVTDLVEYLWRDDVTGAKEFK